MRGEPVRWGFLGAGWIASRAMAPAVHSAQGAVLEAVASRSPERSHSLEPGRVHDSYENLLDDPDIDVVYISLRNGQHREWVERALAAGKHVLCEKPLGLDVAEVRSMFAAASRNERLLVEAVWAQWNPRFVRMIDLARSGALGTLTRIDSSFTFTSDTLDGNYRLDPAMGGGALLDVGCYQVHAWAALCPWLSSSDGSVRITELVRNLGPTGVDLTTAACAQLGRGVDATMRSSFVEAAAQSLRVDGTSTKVRMGSGEAFTSWRESSSLWVGDNEEHFAPVDAFAVMVEAVSERVQGGDAWVVPADQSIAVAELLDMLRTTHPHGTA